MTFKNLLKAEVYVLSATLALAIVVSLIVNAMRPPDLSPGATNDKQQTDSKDLPQTEGRE